MGGDMISQLTIPVPPSANNLFATVKSGRRVKSRQYKAWLADCGTEILVQAPRRHEERKPLLVRIQAELDYRRDLDNTIKPILDMLVHHRIMLDDRWVDEIHARRVPPIKKRPPRCRVQVMELLD